MNLATRSLVVAVALGLGRIESLLAADTGSNDTCATAEAVAGGTVDGNLSVNGDVDYFAFSATPGRAVFVTIHPLVAGLAPLVGAFTDACEQSRYGYPTGAGNDVQFIAVGPPSGVLRIAAASVPNFGFTPGTGDSSGPYRVTVALALDVAIRAVVVVNVTRARQPGIND
jgi:hypothetical protein